MTESAYIPAGACAGCFYACACHDARQHAVGLQQLRDARDCDFYREHQRRRTEALKEAIVHEAVFHHPRGNP